MRSRDLFTLIGSFALVGAAGLVWWSQDSQAVERPPGALEPQPVAIEGGAVDGVAHRSDPAVPADAVLTKSDGPIAAVADPDKPRVRSDTSGATEGLIQGDIQLAVSVLDRIQSITVIVEEARTATANGANRRSNCKYVKVDRGPGTPTFEVRMPFSEYPYVVSVYSPGLNGSRRTITLDAEHALVDDVMLSITPGSPFSILIRDQDQAPYPDVDVLMMAVGEPAGRPTRKGTTDNFGSLVLDDVLAGDYQLSIGLGGQALAEPQTISVPPGVRTYGTKVQAQSHQITVPRGVPVQLLVHDSASYGVADAKVTATATDRIKLTTVETTSDYGGRADFTHLQPGRWQITIEKDGFLRTDRPLTLTAGMERQYLDVKIARSRQ